MTQNQQDYLRYTQYLIESIDCMLEFKELCQELTDQKSNNFVQNASNLHILKERASEELQYYFIGKHSALTVRNSIMEDIRFLSTAITHMEKICNR